MRTPGIIGPDGKPEQPSPSDVDKSGARMVSARIQRAALIEQTVAQPFEDLAAFALHDDRSV
jgi:hypothetical protein